MVVFALLLLLCSANSAFQSQFLEDSFSLHDEACAALADYVSPAHKERSAVQTTVSESLKMEFTMNGKIPWETYIVDDSDGGLGTHYSYSRGRIDAFIAKAKKMKDAEIWVNEPLPTKNVDRLDYYLFAALHHYMIAGARVVLFGSMEPWFEAVAIAFGASHVTVVEYNNLTYDHPQITTVVPQNFVVPESKFDVAIAISAFDHDGLGRYGDPIRADADLRSSLMLQCVVRTEGLAFISVPVGPDVVVYNLHRRYGIERLKLLLRGWHIIGAAGWDDQKVSAAASWRIRDEPVLVLKNVQTRLEL